jgi:hypothetical protein
MNKRGLKTKSKVNIEWSSNFAYAIGLLATDGCIYSDMRHISFVSKDLEQIYHLMDCLNIFNKIGKNVDGNKKGFTYRIQFGDVKFIDFLVSIGIKPAKSKIMGKIEVPKQYFFDFLRGCFDGDGCIYSYWDLRWKSSFMFYVSFVSASKKHIDWLRLEIFQRLKIKGHITKAHTNSVFQLKYAKSDSTKIINNMYYSNYVVCLDRKRLKVSKILAIVNKS